MKSQVLMSDGSVAQGVVAINTAGQVAGGEITQAIPDLEDPVAIAAQWDNFSGVNWAGGDFVTTVAGLNGQAITVLSASPLTTGESFVVNKNKAVRQPCALEFAGSFKQTGISFATAALFANDSLTGLADTVPDPINIVSCYQSSAVQGVAYNATAGTIMHMVLESPLPSVGTNKAVFIGDWINITGLVDTRLNYQNACINYISPDRKTIAVGFSNEAALPSLAIPVVTPTLGTAKANFYNNMSGARNGAGIRFTGTTSTSAAIVSIFGGDDNQVSGALLGDHRVSIASCAPAYTLTTSANWGQHEIRSTSRYMIECYPEAAVIMDKGENTMASYTLRDNPRTSVKPSTEAMMYPRFRLYKPVGMSRPVAKIQSISKAGTTTATVNLAAAPIEPLAVGNVVSIAGVRDQTNFATTSATITAVNTPTQFQVVLGSAVTATSYGGAVSIINGGASLPGLITQYVQSVASRVADGSNWLDVIGNTTWSGPTQGDYIDLYGLRDNTTGADLGLDGAWEVAHMSTTTMVLKPVFNIAGDRVSPALGTLASTPCGGAVLIRPTLRSHDLSLTSLVQNRMSIDGAGQNRLDKAIPVLATGGTFTATQGTSASISTTDGSGGWYIRPAIVGISDIVSAAITATSTGSSTSNDKGNGFQIVVPVTAVTGTLPTMDVRVQESFDGGYTWETLYDFQRITAVGVYQSPILRATGRHVRYVRTVGGTTPSFTTSLTRVLLPFIPAEPQKRLIDRSIVLTTLNSATPILFSGAANNVQLVVNIGAATTPPAIQIEGSEDAGLSWYSIGSPLTAVASSTVQLTANGISATHVRARVSTAGATVTAGYISLKAWS